MYFESATSREVVAASPATAPALVLCTPEAEPQLGDLCAAYRAAGKRCLGGIFPAVLANGERRDRGLVVRPLPAGFDVAVADLSGPALRWVVPPPALAPGATATSVVVVDSGAPLITAFLTDLFDRYGHQSQTWGGGAGFPDLSGAPSVFTEAGLLAAGAAVAVGPSRSVVEVRHGWRRLGPTLVATRTRGNLVFEFDWAPAAIRYREAAASVFPHLADAPFLPDINARTPLAMVRAGSEDIVRDPVSETPEGGVQFLSDVPEHSVLHLMGADTPDMVAAAALAARRLATRAPGAVPFVFDCGSRANVLSEHFGLELAAVHAAFEPAGTGAEGLEGALVLGEIASDGEGQIELYNKTLVVAAFHD